MQIWTDYKNSRQFLDSSQITRSLGKCLAGSRVWIISWSCNQLALVNLRLCGLIDGH
jgi:hypothetical protein